MAVATSTIIAGAAVASAGAGVYSAVTGARNARRAGNANAEQEREATQERLRRLGIEEENILGAQLVGAASANVDTSSASVRAIQQETVESFASEREFVARAGASAAALAEDQGRATAYGLYGRALQSGLQGVQIAANYWGNRPAGEV